MSHSEHHHKRDASPEHKVVVHKHEKTNMVKIAETIKEGEAPSNKQITHELHATKEFLHDREDVASSKREGEALRDARKLVEAAEHTIHKKNKDDKIQQLVHDVAKVTDKHTPRHTSTKAWDETRDFIINMRDLLMQLLKSRTFRQSLIDSARLLRDVFEYQEQHTGATHKMKDAFVSENKSTATGVKEAIKDSANALSNMSLEDLDPAQREKIKHQLKQLLVEVNRKPQTRKAFKNFLRLLSSLQGELYVQISQNKADRDVQKVVLEVKDIIEQFTGGMKTDRFLALLAESMKLLERDQELQVWMKESRVFIERGFNNPELAESTHYYEEGEVIVKRGRYLFRKYNANPTLNATIDEAIALMMAMKKDHNLTELKSRTAKFIDNFTYEDNRGRTHIDTELLSDMKDHLVPFLIERFREIPIPRQDIKAKDFEYLILDDMFLTIDEIVPDQVKIHTENALDVNLRKLSKGHSSTRIKLSIEGVKPKIKDFYFTFKRTGMIKLSDEGRATVRVTGDGIDIYLRFTLRYDRDGNVILGKHTVEARVKGLKIDFLEAQHKGLLNFATSVFGGVIQKQVEKAIVKKLDQLGYDFEDKINKKILSRVPVRGQVGGTIEEKISHVI